MKHFLLVFAMIAGLAAEARAQPLFPLGAFLGVPNAWSATAQAAFQDRYNAYTAMMGAPQFIETAIDHTMPVSQWVSSAAEQAQSNAQTPVVKNLPQIIGLPMFSTAAGSLAPDPQFKQLASGQDDATIQGIVAAYAKQGFTDLYIRLGWEMNLIGGPYYVGADAQSQADWVQAFKHISALLHQAAAAYHVRLQVIWNPGTTGYGVAQTTTNLYPGNSYVDIIAADAYANMYPFQDQGNPPTYHDWATGGEDTSITQFMSNPLNRVHYWAFPAANQWQSDGSGGFALSLTQLIAFAHQQGKPFAIAETGAGNSDYGHDINDDPAFPQWLAAQLVAAQASGLQILFVIFFDYNADGNYEFTSATDNKPLEAAAWAKNFPMSGCYH